VHTSAVGVLAGHLNHTSTDRLTWRKGVDLVVCSPSIDVIRHEYGELSMEVAYL